MNQEGVAIERIRDLRKRRGGVLSSLTAKRKEIDIFLADENNLEAVKVKLSEITSLFQRFTETHNEYNAALVADSQRQESDVYFAEIECNMNFFCQTVNDWLRVTEVNFQELDVSPNDSISQLGLRSRKCSEYGSSFKSQCRKISRISNQFQKFQFWLIPPKHPFRGTLSRNDIKKSPSALHFENFRKVPKFAKNTFFNSGNGCKFQQISTKQYKRAKAPIDLMLLMYLADIHSFKTP